MDKPLNNLVDLSCVEEVFSVEGYYLVTASDGGDKIKTRFLPVHL